MAAMSADSRIKNPAEPARLPPGVDVNNHWNLRRGNFLDDPARGIDQPSRRISLDQYSLIIAPLRFINGAREMYSSVMG